MVLENSYNSEDHPKHPGTSYLWANSNLNMSLIGPHRLLDLGRKKPQFFFVRGACGRFSFFLLLDRYLSQKSHFGLDHRMRFFLY